MTRPVLVTGGAGFIGANLCRRLLAGGTPVRVLDDLSTGALSNLDGLDLQFHEGSVTAPADIRDAVQGVASVVHLAARPSVPRSLRDPVATHEVNVTGTLTVLEAARQAGAHVVVASSSSVYGSTPGLPKHEEQPCRPLSPYAASKLAAEAYASAYAGSWALPVLAVRFFNVFGPLQPAGHAYAAVVPAFVEAALAGRPVTVHGDGRQTRDFTYVGTVCDVLCQAVARRLAHPSPINLAYGNRVSLRRLLELLEDLLGRPVERTHTEPRAGDVRDSQADSTLLRGLFPDLEPTPLEVALSETVDWYRRPSPDRGAPEVV